MPCGTPHDGFIELDLPEWQALVKTGGYKFDNNNQVEYSFSPLVPRPGQFFKDHYFEMETPFTNKELEDLDLFGGALYAEAKANYNAHYKGYENAINVAPINTYTSTDSHNYERILPHFYSFANFLKQSQNIFEMATSVVFQSENQSMHYIHEKPGRSNITLAG